MNLESMLVGHRAGDRLGGFPPSHCPFCGSRYYIVLTEEVSYPYRVKLAGACEQCGAGTADFTVDVRAVKDMPSMNFVEDMMRRTVRKEDLFDMKVAFRLMEG